MVCASSAPPVAGPATTSVRSTKLRRQDVDQVLRESPDRRRISEQLVRVQVDAAVVTVAVVEVAARMSTPDSCSVLSAC